MDVGFRPEFTEALEVLAAAFTAAVARGASQPVIVGGAAVEFYTAGGIHPLISTLLTSEMISLLKSRKPVV